MNKIYQTDENKDFPGISSFSSFIPVFRFLFVFIHLRLRCAAHNFLKLIIMKRHLFNTEKTLWQEFCEYLVTIYWPEAEEYLTEETINWKYKSFKEMMAH
jgi:hypothetical protein